MTSRRSQQRDLDPKPPGWTIRELVAGDLAAVLRLNRENRPALAAFEANDLDPLLAHEGCFLVAVDSTGEVVGFLLSFARESHYDDSEINELRRRLVEPFFYICQVAVAPSYRGRGIGRAFYEAVAGAACLRGAQMLCCDVNLAPANPESLAFHERLGFVSLGEGTASNGFAITFLVRRL